MIDFSKIKTYSIISRKLNKEDINNFPKMNSEISINSNPDLNEVSEKIIDCYLNKKKVLIMFGGHVIKTGMSIYLIDLMKHGLISHIATNGSGSIHDFEISMIGKTSEDVEAGIKEGTFGMADETGRFMNKAINESAKNNGGYGSAIGKYISENNFPFKDYSLFYTAYKQNIPSTVHVAIGTDIIHQHPDCSGASIGLTSYNDFKKLVSTISELKDGLVINIGSAVIMPEVFLKALTIARNLNYPVENLTCVNMDMNNHYRPRVNVVERPTKALGGKGYIIIGNHTDLIPSLYGLTMSKYRSIKK